MLYTYGMPWEVEFHDAFLPEYEGLADAVQDELLGHLASLQMFGPTLGRPWVDTIKGSTIANLKELRFDADGGVWRVLFAFSQRRAAVLLVAGDKRGAQQARFYKKLVGVAESRWSDLNR